MVRTNTSIADTAAALRSGKVAIYPTETVYGLGLATAYADSIEPIYELKNRSKRKPIAWLVSSVDDLTVYGADVPQFAQDAACELWPGPLTLIVKASDAVPAAFRSEQGTIGLRMPNNETALRLISQVGCPLATTSANIAGYPAPRAADDIDDNLASQVAAVLVDDAEKSGVASTILDCTGDHPVVMREGALTIADIMARV